jgi:hypothetical protein
MNSNLDTGQDGTSTLNLPRGSLVISRPSVGVVVFTYHGHASVEFVPFIERIVDRELAKGLRPDLFINLEAMTGYDSDYRKAVSVWGAKNYRRFGDVRVLVRSRLLAMGIAVSNLTASGKLKPTTQHADFFAQLEQAITRHSACSP